MPVLMEIVGFGKYKGEVSLILLPDKSYLQWLFDSETHKPESDQNVELVYTFPRCGISLLKHWL